MASSYSYILWLAQIQTDLYKYGGPILIGLGTISCTLSLMVFMRKNLRKNPCSIYLVAHNITNLLLIYTSILFSTLATGYDIDPSTYNLPFCRFRFYAMLLFDILSAWYLILASIDRVLLTSSNALTRQRSTPRLACVCIIIVTLFWLFFHMHALVLTGFLQIAPGRVICYFQYGMHTKLISYYSAIIKGILTPLPMIIFGLWTVRNVRRAARINPISTVPTSGAAPIRNGLAGHSKDRQLLQMLLIDISIYIIFNIMIAVVLIKQEFGPKSITDPVEAQLQNLLLRIAGVSNYIPFCIECYVKLLASKAFRQEVKRILMRQ